MQIDAGVAGKRHFRDRDQQAAVGHVVASGHRAGGDQVTDEVAVAPFRRQIDRHHRKKNRAARSSITENSLASPESRRSTGGLPSGSD